MKKHSQMIASLLAFVMIFPTATFAGTDWEGWDAEKRDDAWTVFDMTEWTEFESLGYVPSILTTYEATASVSDTVRGYEEQIKAKLQSYTQDYSGYTELMLAIVSLRTNGAGSDIFDIAGLPNYSTEAEISTETSIETACHLLVECVRKSEDANPYKMDALLQAIVIAWYCNDPSLIDYYTEKKYSQPETDTYMEEKGFTIDHKAVLRSLNAIYTCKEVKMVGAAAGSGTVAAGIAGTVDSNERLNWLFPSGVPTTPTEVQPYLTTITVPINTTSGQTTMSLRVHNKLANEIIATFEDLLTVKGFYVDPGDTFGYNWRTMASGTGKISHHSYGCVIDLNANANPPSYWDATPDPSSPYYNNPQVVAIFKAHGFYWGGDWSPSFYDPMHFTYTNH